MTTAYLASTVLMGVLAAVVVGWMLRSRGWYRYSPSAAGSAPGTGSESGWARLDRAAGRPTTWAVAFLLLVAAAGAGLLAYIGGPVESQPLVGQLIAAGGGLLLVSYLLFGVYLAATRRGHPRSMAVAESAVVAGTLFLVGVTARLVMG